MSETAAGAVFATLIVATIVALDLAFFRHHAIERLAVNIGIVLVYGVLYWRYFKR